MRKLLLMAAAASAVCFSGAANAVTCLSGTEYTAGTCTSFYTAGVDPEFSVTQQLDGTISAGLHHDGIGAYNFQDIFWFFTDDNGTGSGGVQTTTSFLLNTLDVDFSNLDIYTGATYNGDGTFTGGTHYSISPTLINGSYWEALGATGIPITALEDNYIVVSGLARGNGSYGGNATFIPSAVPEPATWAMMLFGFGAVGFGMRRRKKDQVRVRFAF